MARVRVPGIADAQPPQPALAHSVEGVIGTKRVRVEAGRAAGVPAEELDGEFVEVELTDGVRLWAPTDRIAADLGATPARDGGDPVLPTVLPLRGSSRSGGGPVAIQAVTAFELELAEGVAAFIKRTVEKGRDPGGQLLQCVAPSAAAFAPPTRLAGAGPVLVFLHGTASSTDGSFGGLWEAVGANRPLRIENPGARINGLFAAYQGGVLALEHRSLSESPIANARALMEQLATIVAPGREIHLVSHSRGGLIGELLCRGMRTKGPPFDDTDLNLFNGEPEATAEAKARRLQDRASLQALGQLLKEQRYRIGRFVRVACPAAGTTLADGRLDRYVSMLVNVAGRVSGLSADPTYAALTNLLAAVLKERTRPESLPGLEAMMPMSPLVRLLNRRDAQTEAPLHVLGGDLAITGFWSALKAIATDFYYREDHDLVVNTPSMLRGLPRSTAVKYWIDTAGEVSHFNYFRRSDTASRLTAILTTGDADVHDLAVEPSDVDGDAYRKRDAATQPTLILIPGFMGSHLAADGRVWADTARLAQGGLAALGDGRPVTPDGLVGLYDDLVRWLSATHAVQPFAYDWRQPAAATATALLAVLEARLATGGEAATQPIRLLAHGAGGRVLQAMLSTPDGQAVWSRVCVHPASRAVVLGHPFGGTAHAALAMAGVGPLVDGVASIDLTHDAAWIGRTLAGFAGLRELAPAPAGTLPAMFRDRSRVVFVAGTAEATPVAVSAADGGPVVERTADGDGYAPWAAIPEALRDDVYLAPVDHGGLITADEMRPALVDLLTTGRTGRLGALPPSSAEGATRGAPLRRLQGIPTDAELVASGLGVEMRPRRAPRQKVSVRVVHGNLSRATSPVVVGHYAQDVFANAEDYLDRQVNGRLRERHAMRLYPEAIGSVAIAVQPIDAPCATHPGAIVVGLGVVGELTAGSLVQTLETGLTAYGAERVAERLRDRAAGTRPDASGNRPGRPAPSEVDVLRAPVTALLVGSGEAGLSLRDSIHALLRAVQGANDRLHAPAAAAKAANRLVVPLTARIDALSILELYEDRAVEALRTLHELAVDAEFADDFDIAPILEIGAEGRQRVSFEEQAAWWQRLRVIEQDASIDPKFKTHRRVLKFEAYTERARIDAYAVDSQRALAEAFIADAVRTTAADQSLGRALFEMLVPNAIKERAPDRRDTVLLLDAASASVPWELFEDGLSRDRRGRRPLAIEAGLVRQLVDEHGRLRVRQAVGTGALVVGDPPVGDPRFAPLPGAAAEATAVAAQLAGPFDVTSLIGAKATPQAILGALHERPWRVLHLAMHGVFAYPAVAGGADLVTGAVAGTHVYLAPSDFNQMRYVPDLVFLNCCHVGNTSADAAAPVPRYPELAANLATQFIRMGARAVVAAGWAVDDLAAQAFAQTFYAEMQRGRPFGEAVFTARKGIHRRFSHVNTWGAYQCYGDPAFCLSQGRKPSRPWRAVCLRELLIEADAIANQAKVATDADVSDLRRRLDDLVAAADGAWLRDARAAVALGAAYGELSDFARAIDYYERARQAERADLSGTALEQLANLQARYAEHVWRDSRKTATALAEAEARLDDAERLLRQLVALNGSAERQALLGALAKRRATIRVDRDRAGARAALAEMRGHYEQAYAIKVKTGQSDAFWPYMSTLVASLAESWLRPIPPAKSAPPATPAPSATPARARKRASRKASSALSAAQRETVAAFEQVVATRNDFWALGFLAEAALLRALHAGDIAEVTSDALIARYRDAQRRGRSRRELDSMLAEVRLLARVAARSEDPTVVPLGASLDQLVDRLAGS